MKEGRVSGSNWGCPRAKKVGLFLVVVSAQVKFLHTYISMLCRYIIYPLISYTTTTITYGIYLLRIGNGSVQECQNQTFSKI